MTSCSKSMKRERKTRKKAQGKLSFDVSSRQQWSCDLLTPADKSSVSHAAQPLDDCQYGTQSPQPGLPKTSRMHFIPYVTPCSRKPSGTARLSLYTLSRGYEQPRSYQARNHAWDCAMRICLDSLNMSWTCSRTDLVVLR